MEGKVVIMSALLVSLVVLGHIQVEAQRLCCPNNIAQNVYNACRRAGGNRIVCASVAGCSIAVVCPRTNDILENTVNEYCKLGCVSSVCSAMSTLQNSDATEVVNGAVEKCINACSASCTKGSVTSLETAA